MGCLLVGVMKVLQNGVVAQSCEYDFLNGLYTLVDFRICELQLNKEQEGLYVLRWYNIQNTLNEKKMTEQFAWYATICLKEKKRAHTCYTICLKKAHTQHTQNATICLKKAHTHTHPNQ